MRRYFVEHTIRTAAEQGWGKLANGELLQVAERDGFQVMVTADQSIAYQQNLKGRKLALVVLGTNDLDLLEAQPERLVAAVEAATAGSYEFLRYELPPKPPWISIVPTD